MERKIENTDDVIFIAIQKAFECFRNLLPIFIEKQCKEYYLRLVEYITASFPNYTCEQCGLSTGASNTSVYSENELCDACKEKLIHLITLEHLSQSTNLSNIKWTDINNISWQLFKFYIDEPGHIDTSSARAAGINALFQICMNHNDIKRGYGDDLLSVKEIYDSVLQSRTGHFSEELCQRLIRAIQAILRKNALRSSEKDFKLQLDVICSILRHEQHVTYEDELVARRQIIQDLNNQIAVETVIDRRSCNEKLSNLTVSLRIHQRALKRVQEAIHEEFLRAELELQEEQTVLKKKQDTLKKNKDTFNKYMTEVDQFSQQTTVVNNISVNKGLYNSAIEKHTFTLVADMHEDMKELINGNDEHRNSISNFRDEIREIHTVLAERLPWIVLTAVKENTELKLKLYPTGGNNDEIISNDLITAGQQLLKGEMPTDLHFRHLHDLLKKLLADLQNGGNEIRNITHGCVAIHIGCPTLTNLKALCEKFLNGRLTELLQPLQEYIRTLPGCKDVNVVPIIFERDYLKCIMKIVSEVKIALHKRQLSSTEVNLGSGTVTKAHECTMVRDTDGLEFTKLHDDIKCKLQHRAVDEKELFPYFHGERKDSCNESDEKCVDMRNEEQCNDSQPNESSNSQTANTTIRDFLHGIVPTCKQINEDEGNNFGKSNVVKSETQYNSSESNDASCLEKNVNENIEMTLNTLEINDIKGTNGNIIHELPATNHERDLIEGSEISEKSHQPGRVSASIYDMKPATSDICLDKEVDTCDKNLNEFDGFEIIQKRSDDYEFIERDMFKTNEQNSDINTMCIENQIEESEYERSCKDMLETLKKHYIVKFSHVTIFPLITNLVKKIPGVYLPPKLFAMSKDKGAFKKTDKQVTKYADLFITDDKVIFVQGEAGSGKTTFLSKLVLDWCEHLSGDMELSNITDCTEPINPSVTSETSCMASVLSETIASDSSAEYSDVSCNIEAMGHAKNSAHRIADLYILRCFQFVFHIALRNSVKEKDVTTMIKEQIIDSIYCQEDREKAYRLVNEILKRERCLLLLDGLDEWTGPGDHHILPKWIVFHSKCVMLITTRPWKLAEGKIRHSDIDALLQLEGINEPFQLSRMMLSRLVDKKELDMKYSAFKQYIGQQKLDELLSSPMIMSVIVCSWVEETLLKGSKCEIYTLILESLFKKASSERCEFQQHPFPCFTGTQYIQPNIEHVNRIADVAFHFLFVNTKPNSQVLSIADLKEFKMDERKETEFALKSGILSIRRDALTLRPASSFTFIHRSIQEFFAAYHIARNTNLVDAVIFGYLNRHKDSYLDISTVFTFLCGLNISAANKLSSIMDKRVPADALRSSERIAFQEIILAGYREALANKHIVISLKLSHFYFNEHNISLSRLWTNNASNALSLEVKREMNMLETRRISPASDESASHMKFDLSSCRKLKSLHILGNDILLNDSAPTATLDLSFWIVLNSADPAQCTDPFPVLPSIEHISLTRVTCSSTWLCSLFSTLLTLDHEVKCELEDCQITSSVEVEVSKSSTDGSVSITSAINKTFAICLDGDIGPGLWEAMNGLIIKSLSLLGRFGRLNANRLESLSQLLSSLIQMEELSINVEYDSPGLCEDLHGMNIKRLSLLSEREDFKVNHEKSLSESLPSLRHLETLSISVSEDSSGLCEPYYCPDINSLWDSYECLNVNHTGSLSQSLSSLTQVETLSNGVYEDSPCLWEALRGLNIKMLSLCDKWGGLRVNHDESLSKSLSSLTQLEMLGLYVHTYIDLQLPKSLKYFNIFFDTLRPSELLALVDPLQACTQTVEVKLEFGWTSYEGSLLQEYIQIQQELGARKHVVVQRFRIYDLTRDKGGVDGDAYDALSVNDDLYKTFAKRMNINNKTNRISIRLQISPDSI